MKEAFIDQIIEFWFTDIKPKDWFTKNPDFDALLEQRFGDVIEDAIGARLDSWAKAKKGRLAHILLLDPNDAECFRDTPKAFAGDDMALAMSLQAVHDGFLEETSPKENQFFLMPMMHSENLDIPNQSIPLFEQYTSRCGEIYKKTPRYHVMRFGHFSRQT